MQGRVATLSLAVVLSAGSVVSAQSTDPFATARRPGSGINNPSIARQPEPRYTREAMAAKIEGTVELEAVVQTDGTVGAVRIVKSLDSRFGLDEEAVKAAKLWLFRPGTDSSGTPVPVRVTLILEFRLSNPRTAPQMSDEEFKRDTFADHTPGLVKPVPTTLPEPKYTSDAMRAKLQGIVKLDVVVAADGSVSRARIAQSLDTLFGLDQEALRAIRLWQFRPGTFQGTAVPVLTTVTMEFRLH